MIRTEHTSYNRDSRSNALINNSRDALLKRQAAKRDSDRLDKMGRELALLASHVDTLTKLIKKLEYIK